MPGTTAKSLLDYLATRRNAMVDMVEWLVRAESPSTDAESQSGVFDALSESLATRQFRCRRLRAGSSGGVILASPATRVRPSPYQVLLGHCDTVWPIGTLDEMPVRITDGEFHGPGAYDMKGGLVQGIFAVDAVRHALGREPKVTPVFLVNSDEEIGSRGSTPHVQRLARRADRVFVLEPAMGRAGDLKTARKGIGRFTVRVRGKAAHAGLEPGQGVSAILELSHVIQSLFALNDVERGITVNVGTIDGGLRPNVVAPESRAVVDVRVPTQEAAERIEQAIRGLRPSVPGTELDVVGGIGRPPLERTAQNRELWKLAQEAAGELGVALGEASAGGGSDGNTTSLLAPTLDGLGAVGDGAHAAHEFLFVEKMVERAALLALLLAQPPVRDTWSTP